MASSSQRSYVKTKSRHVRELSVREDITDTRSLVLAFNDAKPDSDERAVLLEWLNKYVELWFDSKVTMPIEIEAYALLANVECLNDEEHKFYQNLYVSLAKISVSPCPESVISAIDRVLSTISVDFLEKNNSDLISLANKLLDKISPTAVSYSRSMYKKHVTHLFAVQQILTRLHELEADQLTKNMHDQFRSKLTAIEECVEYYPYFFHARIIKTYLRSLAEGNFLNPLVRFGRCLFHFTCGGIFMIQGLRAIGSLTFDMSAIIEGCKRWKQAASEIRTETWFVKKLTSLLEAAKKTIVEKNYEHFRMTYNSLKIKKPRITGRGGKMVQFGLIAQLHLLAMKGPSDDIQNNAANELLRLGGLPRRDEWIRDLDVFEALIEAVADIHRKESYQEQARGILLKFEDNPSQALQKKFSEWKAGKELDQKLSEKAKPQRTEGDKLFLKSRDAMGMTMTHEDIVSTTENLKEYYKCSNFTKVNSKVLAGH